MAGAKSLSSVLQISISTVVWQKKILEYAVKNKLGIREALYEEWPLLMRKIMDMTPPFATKKVRTGPDSLFATSASDLSVGRLAVKNDILKTMEPFDPSKVRTKGLKRIIETQNIEGFNVVARRSKSGPMQGKTAVYFSANQHLSRRNARGRVGRSQRQVVIGAGVGLLKQYIAEVQSRVGYAKSGWLKALLLVGGTAPSYVTNKGTGGGTVIDDHANEDNPSITAINRTPWAVRKDEGDRILAAAKASRIQAIISKIRTKERLARKQAGLAA